MQKVRGQGWWQIFERSLAGRAPEAGPTWHIRDQQENHVAEVEGARGTLDADGFRAWGAQIILGLVDPSKNFCVSKSQGKPQGKEEFEWRSDII